VCRRLALLGVHRDGALQELLTVPTASVVATPTLSSAQAALVEPVSIGVHAAARARVAPGDSVVVFGAGPIGVASALAARDRGGDVLVVDPVDARRDLLARAGFAVTWAEDGELAAQVARHSGPAARTSSWTPPGGRRCCPPPWTSPDTVAGWPWWG
jgi:threonine dehydrogenase-like Zn-dependent dehydrogenase